MTLGGGAPVAPEVRQLAAAQDHARTRPSARSTSKTTPGGRPCHRPGRIGASSVTARRPYRTAPGKGVVGAPVPLTAALQASPAALGGRLPGRPSGRCPSPSSTWSARHEREHLGVAPAPPPRRGIGEHCQLGQMPGQPQGNVGATPSAPTPSPARRQSAEHGRRAPVALQRAGELGGQGGLAVRASTMRGFAVVPTAVETPDVADHELGLVVDRGRYGRSSRWAGGRTPWMMSSRRAPSFMSARVCSTEDSSSSAVSVSAPPDAVGSDDREAVAGQEHLGPELQPSRAAPPPTPSDSAGPSGGSRQLGMPR